MGQLDDAALHVFTHGLCGELAWALHVKTGWPCIRARSDDGCGGGWGAHLGVLRPDGRVLDVEGSHDAEAWGLRWGFRGEYQLTDSPREPEHKRWLTDLTLHACARELLGTYRYPLDAQGDEESDQREHAPA
jgi:hypothetical protein